MMIPGNYVGRRAYIHCENGDEIAATVIEHNKKYLSITVDNGLRGIETSSFVTVIILTEDGIHEYDGRVRKMLTSPSTADIALSKGKLKEQRHATRYSVKTFATVESLIMNGKENPLLNPVKVFVVNLSISGAMLRAGENCFDANAKFELNLTIKEQPTRLKCEIVWIRKINNMEEYGCKFLTDD